MKSMKFNQDKSLPDLRRMEIIVWFSDENNAQIVETILGKFTV
jgi:hypothetical protein